MHDMRLVPLLSVIRALKRQLPAGRLVLRVFVFKRSPGNPQPIPDLACVQTPLPSVKISSTEGRGFCTEAIPDLVRVNYATLY